MPRLAVVELFTSQGCSSCPPADAFMQELVQRPDTIALTYNVDYWDYLGWRDTLGSPAHSQRQYDYAKSRGDMDVYTPQMIIDGRTHFVGSHRKSVEAAIRRSVASTPSLWVALSVTAEGKDFVIVAGARRPAPEATVWLMTVAPQISVAIEKGENAGRAAVYVNVVRNLIPAGAWSGSAMTLRIPASSVMTPGCTACVALLQTGTVGPIIGVARWSAKAS